jgi:hypothetical protein
MQILDAFPVVHEHEPLIEVEGRRRRMRQQERLPIRDDRVKPPYRKYDERRQETNPYRLSGIEDVR